MVEERAEKILAPFESENVSELHLQQEQGDFSIELDHVVFEDNMVIFDYTMKAPNAAQYVDVHPELPKKVDEMGIAVEEHPEMVRWVGYIIVEDGTFSQEDVGKEIEIPFVSFEYGDGSDIDMVFHVTIENVLSTEMIDLGREFSLEEGTVMVKSIEVSIFYTKVYFEDMTDETTFITDLYSWEIMDESGKTLPWLGGRDAEYFYTAMPKDCSEIGLTLVKYRGGKGNLSYDKIGEMVKIPIIK